MSAYRGGVVFFGVALMVLGVAMTVRTALHGFGIGLLLGPLFAGLGAGRLYLAFRKR